MGFPDDLPREHGSSPLRPALAVLSLAVLALVAFAPLVRHPGWLLADGDRPSIDRARPVGTSAIGNDLTRLFLPMHLRTGQAVRLSGSIPRWDPIGFGGRPLVGNPQASLWYPPVWLMWTSGGPSLLGWITVAHLVWAGVGTSVLARSRGVGVLGSFLAGSTFELSPYLLAQTMEGHLPHVWSASWYPWAFWSALHLREGRWRASLFLPPILAMGFLSGHPQEPYYLVVALGLGLLVSMARRPRGLASRLLLISTITMVMAAALSAVEWLPDALAQEWGLKRGLSPRRAAAYSVGWADWLQLLGPRALGGPADYLGQTNYWDSLLSFGLVPLALTAVAASSAARSREVRGWTILVLASVAFSMGQRLGVYPLMYRIVPGMDWFRVPSRALFLAALGVSVLAGMGLDALRRQEASAKILLGFSGAVLAVLFGGWLAPNLRETAGGRSPAWISALQNLAHDPMVWLGAVGLILVSSWPYFRTRKQTEARPTRPARSGLWSAVLVCALALAQGLAHAWTSIKVAPLERFLKPRGLAESLPEAPFPGPFRVRARDAFLDDLSAVHFEIDKTNLNDWFQIAHSADLYETLYPIFDPPRLLDLLNPLEDWQQKQVRQAVLDRMGVAFLISDRKDVDARWPIVHTGTAAGRRFWICKNPTAMPRAYVVPEAKIAPDDLRTVWLMPWVPPRKAVLMPEDPLRDIPGPRQPFHQADYQSEHPDQVEIQIKTEAPGYLVIADTWMPGWLATLDGREVPVLRGNRAQRVVVIPYSGNHHVILRYEPPGLMAGMTISALAWLLWAGAILLRRVRHCGPSASRKLSRHC